MRVAQTTSGAYVVQLDYVVVKLGDGPVGLRIGEQAQWLERYASNGVMPVYATVGSFAYAMPVAREWPVGRADGRSIFDTVTELLKEYVWCHPAEETSGWTPSMLFALKLGDMLKHTLRHHAQSLWDIFVSIDWDALPACLTHGDPTFCNTMWVDGRPVLCDPIPSGKLPDLRALDLGKLLQSCFGFETIVYGWRYNDPIPNPLWVRDLCEDDNEWLAAIAFGALHILRLLPYVDPTYHEEFTRVLDEMLRLRA